MKSKPKSARVTTRAVELMSLLTFVGISVTAALLITASSQDSRLAKHRQHLEEVSVEATDLRHWISTDIGIKRKHLERTLVGSMIRTKQVLTEHSLTWSIGSKALPSWIQHTLLWLTLAKPCRTWRN